MTVEFHKGRRVDPPLAITLNYLRRLLEEVGLHVEDLVPGINCFEGGAAMLIVIERPDPSVRVMWQIVRDGRPFGIRVQVALVTREQLPIVRSVAALSPATEHGLRNLEPLLDWLKQHAEVVEC